MMRMIAAVSRIARTGITQNQSIIRAINPHAPCAGLYESEGRGGAATEAHICITRV